MKAFSNCYNMASDQLNDTGVHQLETQEYITFNAHKYQRTNKFMITII